MKSIKKLGLIGLCAVAVMAMFLIAQSPAEQPKAGFPPIGWDNVQSAALFRIYVYPAFQGYMTGYPGYVPPGPGEYWGKLTSPLMYEPTTLIARSDPHVDASWVPDFSGSWIGTGPDAEFANEGNIYAFGKPPGFNTLPRGNRQEVHTAIGSMILYPLSTGPNSLPRLRAGHMAETGMNGLESYGEVESDNFMPNPDFPAHSFFAVTAQVDLGAHPDYPNPGTFPGGTLFTVNRLFLVATGLIKFPPTVVYSHTGGRWGFAPVVRMLTGGPTWSPGAKFGKLVLAGHGLGFGPAPPPSSRDSIPMDVFDSIMGTIPDLEPLPVIDCPWPEEEGYDTIPFNIFDMGFYRPWDTINLHKTIRAGGENVVIWRGPYDDEVGYMPTEIVQLHGCGVRYDLLGGPFQISLAPHPPSEGYIAPCDASCEMAESKMVVYYDITSDLLGTFGGEAEEMVLVNACDPEDGWNPMAGGTWGPPLDNYWEYYDPRKTPIYDALGNLIGYIWHKHKMFTYGVHDCIFRGSDVTFGWYQDGVPWTDEWYYGYRLLNSGEIAYESHTGLLDFRQEHPEFDEEDVDFTFLCPSGANGWRQTITHFNGVSDVYAYNIDVTGLPDQWQIPDLVPDQSGVFYDTIYTAVDFATYAVFNPDGFADGEWEEGQTVSNLNVEIVEGEAENCQGIYWAESEFQVPEGREAPIPTGGLKDLLNTVTYPTDLLIAAVHSGEGFGTSAGDCCEVPGDANDDKETNVGDVVHIINHVFRDGPMPACGNAADANHDCSLNIGDAVFLINHIFKNGPAPECGCVE
jgi:hypothetical protein